MKNTESLKISVRERLDAESQALLYSQQVATGAKQAASLTVLPFLSYSCTRRRYRVKSCNREPVQSPC